jgi:hypothetical protein
MSKSKWIEVMEWCVMALVALILLGVFLTGAGEDEGRMAAPLTHVDE